jgi:hypothetical protein
VLILGIILALCGYFFAIQILWVVGIILIVVGAVLLLVGTVGHREIGGRRYWF